MSRKDFLNTKFSDSDNRFNLSIPILNLRTEILQEGETDNGR